MAFFSDNSQIAAVASLIAAFAAVTALCISIWQGSQLNKSLKLTIAETRPILNLDININSQSSDLSRIQFIVKNSGPIPARILHKTTQPWVDSETRRPTNHNDIDIISPGETHIISSFDINQPLLQKVINGNSDLRYAIAILYSSTTNDDYRKWITDTWVVYSTRKKGFALKKRNEMEVDKKVDKCELDNLKPPDWLEWTPPK